MRLRFKFLCGIILSLIFTGAYSETRPWTDEEKLWGIAAGTSLVIDWGQTRWSASHDWPISTEHPYRIREKNPILGKYPSTEKVNNYFMIVTPLLFLLADQSDEYRKPILIVTTVLESVTIVNNGINVGMRFSF
jgi:hypothetical protein